MVEDVPPEKVWEALRTDPEARLVDVRTDAEWNLVGIPDLGAAGKEPVLIPWQFYPAMQRNTGFLDQLKQAGVTSDERVYFMCRSGGRSRAAAQAAQMAGYAHAYNVADGFEGPLDIEGHRGTISGWKAKGLPWRQG